MHNVREPQSSIAKSTVSGWVTLLVVLLTCGSFSAAHGQGRGLASDATVDEKTGGMRSERNAATGSWSRLFQPPGVNGPVFATAKLGDKIYVGGDFTKAGDVETRDLAVWDTNTKQWKDTGLELDPRTNDRVEALTVHDGRLYIGGHFDPIYAAGENIVVIEGGFTFGFGDGLYQGSKGQGIVYDIAVRSTGSGSSPEVLAVGDITDAASGANIEGFARWTGSQWSAPSRLTNSNARGVGRALQIVAPDSIVVGGDFEDVQQKPGGTRNIAAWNPSTGTWSRYVEGVAGPVYDIDTYKLETQSGVRQALHIGGDFTRSAAGAPLDNLAAWTGSRWTGINGGVTTSSGPGSATVYALASGPRKLRVGGDFTAVGTSNLKAEDVAAFTTAWESWKGGTGRDADVSSVRAFYHDPNRRLTFVGGTFDIAGDPTTPGHRKGNGIARWDDPNDRWEVLGKGVERGRGIRVNAIAERSGGVYIGGQFRYVGGVPVYNVARWRQADSSWVRVGTGVNGEVLALTTADDGALYVGGEFTTARTVSDTLLTRHVARWESGQWDPLAGGTDAAVSALAVDGSTVYAGGRFTQPGQYVARWDGAAWSRLGGGMDDTVLALDYRDGNLYAGGRFTTAGGTSANHVALWSGSAWAGLSGGTNASVSAVEVSPFGEVYVGGLFTEADGKTVNQVARWYGGTWYALENGTNLEVKTLDHPGGCKLYAGGAFTKVSGTDAGGVAAWNSTSWSFFAEQLDTGSISSLESTESGVFVGGNFGAITGSNGTTTVSSRFGRWTGGFPGTSPPVEVSLAEPQSGPVSYAAVESVSAEVSDPSSISSLDFEYSFDGGDTWTSVARGVSVNSDSVSVNWKVPVDSSATEIMLRAQSSTRPCLGSDRTYDYLNPQAAGKRVTHLYRGGSSRPVEYFYPDRHGYQFPNDSSSVWPASVWPSYAGQSQRFQTRTQADSSYFASWDVFCDAAGQSFCFYSLPMTPPKERAMLTWRLLSQNGFRGACAGLAVSSYLAFENNSTVLSDLGINAYDPIHPLSASTARRPIAKYFTREFTYSFLQKIANQSPTTPNQTLKAVRTMLSRTPKQGGRPLRNLTIWTLGRPRSQIDSLSQINPMGHVLTPYRVEQDPNDSDIWYIYVYDGNRPGTNRARVTVDTAANSWNYPDRFIAGPDGYSGQGLFAGLFLGERIQKYVGPRNPLKRTRAKSTPLASKRTAGSARRKASSLLDTYVRMRHTQGSHVAVQDQQGRSIAYDGGTILNEMRGEAFPLMLRTGRPQPPLGFVVPDDRTYSIEASRFPERNFLFSVDEPATTFTFKRPNANNGETDRLRYGTSGLAVTNPNDTTKTYQADAIYDDGDQERTITLSDLQLPQTGGDFLTLDRPEATKAKAAQTGALTVTNEGPATTFDLELRRLSSEGEAQFSNFGVSVPSDARLQVEPDWAGLPDAPVTIQVDQGADGTIDTTRTLLDEPSAPTRLSATAGEENVELHWSPPTQRSPAGYNVYRASASFTDTSEAEKVNDQLITDTTYVDDSDLAGTHYYRVAAVSEAGGEGAFSETAGAFLYPGTVNVAITQSFADADEPGDYRLVALPGAVDRLLGDAIDGSAGTEWQAWWDNGSSENYLQKYDGSGQFDFQSGRGFWLASTQNWTVETRLPTVSLREDTTTVISVHEGWNIISNPLDRSVSWTAVEKANAGMLQPLWRFDRSFAQADSFRSAKTGEAFYFLNDGGRDSLRIPYPDVFPTKTGKSARSPSTLRLVAEPAKESASSSTVRIGIKEAADLGLGPSDQPVPSVGFSAANLRLVAPAEAPARQQFLGAEWRPPSVEGGHVFDLRLRSGAREPVTITAHNLSAVGDRTVALLNPQTGQSHDLRESPTVQLSATDSTALRLAVGDEAFVADQEQQVRPSEVQFAVYPNPMETRGTLSYALPKKTDVRIEVYDLLGRRVALIEDGQKKAGRHRVQFNPAGLASGVYFGRLKTDRQTLTEKITVVR